MQEQLLELEILFLKNYEFLNEEDKAVIRSSIKLFNIKLEQKK